MLDAFVNGGNTTNVVRLTVMSSAYTSNPNSVNKDTQYAIVHIRHYDRSDQFNTFTCNPL